MSFYRRSDSYGHTAPTANVGSNRATVQRYGGRTPLPHAPRLAFYTPTQRRYAYGDPITDAILKAAKAGVDAGGGNGGSNDPGNPNAPAGTSSGVSLTKILGGGAALAAVLWWWKR